MKKQLLVFSFFCCAVLFSQTTIKGSVYDIYLEPLAYISVSTEKGSTVTDEDGNFTLAVKQTLPLKIKVSGVGYQGQTIEVVDFEEISIVLERKSKLQEVILSASRTPERVIESPVSVEILRGNDLKNITSLNFFESLVNLKGIDVLHNSYNIKNVVSNRGFANTENTRFVQLVDGIETTLPFINYSLGNTMGVSDLDINAVEILPGAASALYGANAFNGIMLMRTKNPFDHQGISTYIKGGVTTQESGEAYGFYDFGIRMARAFSNKFAAKVNFTYNNAEDWHANDKRNTNGQGGVIIEGFDHNDDVGYDGVNVYGDEIDTNLIQLGLIAADAGFIPYSTVGSLFVNEDVSRVGNAESDLVDYGTESLRFDGVFHYRPFGNEDLEISLGAKYNLGDNIIHGYNRYSQKNGLTQQYKTAINGKNFSVKAYFTKNYAELVDLRLLGINLNNQYLDNATYFTDLFFGYTGGIAAGNNPLQSLRSFIDVEKDNKPEVGSELYNTYLNLGKTTSILDGGALLTDESQFYHVDANYNFSHLIKVVDLQVGGSYRDYELNSGGEIYSDADASISTKEFGVYAQAQKKLLEDALKLTFTARYDKSNNFDFKVSPRASIAYAVGESKNHNIRISYQTGFRNPTTQDQYANMDLGDRKIVGTVRDNLSRINHFYSSPSQAGRDIIPEGVFLQEQDIIENSFTAASVEAFKEAAFNDVLAGESLQDVIANNNALLVKADLDYIEPETVQTFELGYRGAFNVVNNLFEFDIAGFYNIYENFLTQKSIVVPFYGDVDLQGADNNLPGQAILYNDIEDYILRTNATSAINSFGLNVGFNTKISGGFDLAASYAFSKFEIQDKDEEFNVSYNTPENVFKLSFGHEKLFNNFGFRIDARWQDEYLYQSVFIQDIIESRTVLDAQLSYSFPKIKSKFKFGATNLGGKGYSSIAGAGTIGSQYYINWTINN